MLIREVSMVTGNRSAPTNEGRRHFLLATGAAVLAAGVTPLVTGPTAMAAEVGGTKGAGAAAATAGFGPVRQIDAGSPRCGPSVSRPWSRSPAT